MLLVPDPLRAEGLRAGLGRKPNTATSWHGRVSCVVMMNVATVTGS